MKSGMINKDSEEDPIVVRFQEMVGKFDSLVSANSAFHKLASGITISFEDLSKSHQLIVESLGSFKQRTQDTLKIASDLSTNHGLAIGSLGSSLEAIKKEFLDLKYLYAELTGKFSDISTGQKSLAAIESVKSVEKSLEELKKNFISNVDSNSSHINDVEKQHQDLKGEVSALSEDLVKAKNTIVTQAITLSSLMNELGSVKLTSTTAFHDLKGIILQKLEERIAAIPHPVIPSLNDAKAAMQSSLEPVILDAQNAKLRSSNNESKILILEKKVEQLQLLLNKYQLQG